MADDPKPTPPEPEKIPPQDPQGAGAPAPKAEQPPKAEQAPKAEAAPEPTRAPAPKSAVDPAALAAAQEAVRQAKEAQAKGGAAAPTPPPAPAAPGPVPSPDPAPFELATFSRDGSAPATRSIDLLADVNLNVKIELGRTRMLVEDVLRLAEGAVLELDKLAGDPVDVFVNERPIARGEVLVLNDNFCVRINEILTGETASPERAKSA